MLEMKVVGFQVSIVPLIRYWFHLSGFGGSNSAIGNCLELAFIFLFKLVNVLIRIKWSI